MTSMNRLNPFLLWLAAEVLVAGCTGVASGPTPAPPRETGAAAEAPTDDRPAATVNGEAIRYRQLYDVLIDAGGQDALSQLVLTAAVNQAARREGITVTAADIADETAKTLQEFVPGIEPAQHETLLKRILAQQRNPRIYWDMTIRRNAILRKMAVSRVRITDAMLTAEYNRRYGLKVVCRHIQCASAIDAQKLLKRIADGEDFAELARRFSTNAATAAKGGLLPPFSRDERRYPDPIRDAAFDLADGEVSEIIQVDRDFHILKREKVLPRRDVAFEDVKDELRRTLFDAGIRPMITRLSHELYNAADVQILDPVLKSQARRQALSASAP